MEQGEGVKTVLPSNWFFARRFNATTAIVRTFLLQNNEALRQDFPSHFP